MDPFSKLLFCCCSIVVLGCERRNTHIGEVYWHKTWLVICVLVVIFFFLTLYSWLLWPKTDVDAEFVSQVPIQVYRDPGTGQKKNNSTDNNSLLLLYLCCFKVSIYPPNQNIAAVKKPLRWLIDPNNSMSPKHSGQRWSSRTGPSVVIVSH